MYKILALAAIVVSSFGSVRGEDFSLDSLRQALDRTSIDSIRIILLNEIGDELANTDTDSAFFYLNRAQHLAKKSQSEAGVALVGYTKSTIFTYSGKLDSASIYALSSLKYFEKAQDTLRILGLTREIAKIYQLLNQFDESWKFYKKAGDMAYKQGDPKLIGGALNDFGSYYINRGWFDSDSTTFHFNKAEAFILDAINYFNQAGYERGVALCYGNLAYIAEANQDFTKALNYSRRGLVFFKKLNLDMFVVASYNQISKIYETLNQPDSALYFGEKTYQLAEILDSKIDLRNASARIANASELLGQYKIALDYQKLYHNYHTMMLNEQNNQTLIEIEKKYASEKKATENQLLRKENVVNEYTIKKQQSYIIYAVSAIALLLVLGLFIYRAFAIRKKLIAQIRSQNHKIEADNELIQEQKHKLEELDKAKSRFFANISHDLRSPLTMVRGGIQNALEDKDTYLSQNAENQLKSGLLNSERIIKLSDEIIDLSVLQEGKLNLNTVSVIILEYLKRLVGMFSSAAQAKDITLNFNANISENATVCIDPEQFEKIIYNILSNAIKYTESNGKIEVLLTENSDNLQISIADTGSGISSESLPYIFDRYYQSPSNRYRSREGLGIGLSLVKELVTLHKGTIKVDSESDVGTTFIMHFPLLNTVWNQSIIPEASSKIHRNQNLDQIGGLLESTDSPIGEIDFNNGKKEDFKVLIVEDHPEIKNYINHIITSKYHTVLSSNGKEALKVLSNQRIDLVVTDLMMPWMDGFELMEAISQDDQLHKIPVLVLSARTDESDRFKVLNKGVNDFLSKPFNKDELLLRIQNLLKQRENWEKKDHLTLMEDVGLQKELKNDIVQKVENYIISRISDPQLSVTDLGRELAASERQVYRLIKKVAGMTPYEFIKEVRYQYAHHLILKNKVSNLSEAAKAIGMSNPSHFKNQYNKRFTNKLK